MQIRRELRGAQVERLGGHDDAGADAAPEVLALLRDGVELLVGLNDHKLHREEVRLLELLRDLGHLCANVSICWETLSVFGWQEGVPHATYRNIP